MREIYFKPYKKIQTANNQNFDNIQITNGFYEFLRLYVVFANQKHANKTLFTKIFEFRQERGAGNLH